jgi:hypothetical protein
MNRCVLSVLIPAFVTACCATGAFAQGPPNGLGVNVLNTPLAVTGSVTTSGKVDLVPGATVSVGNPADIAKSFGIQQPVAFELTFDRLTNGGVPFTVPTNKRLIIEYISGTCILASAGIFDLNLQLGSTIAPGYHLFSQDQIPFARPTFNHMVKIYANAGSILNLAAAETSSSGSSAFLTCKVTASGQLLDVP